MSSISRPGSRRGMTVLGQVPKPINLPSQRLENRGLDPNVALVPRGTLTWGVNQSISKSPPNTTGWGGQSASPPKAAGGAWGSQPSSRPSSASTPAGGMNDAAWPDIKAASSGPSSRPTSAAGKVEQQGPSESGNGPQTQSRLTSTPTSQLLSIEHRPHSAEARSGAVSDHNRSGDGGPFMPAWRGAADRKQGEQGTSHLSRGDFPSLGADPETKDALRENGKVGEVKDPEMGRPRSADERGGRQGSVSVHDMEQSGPYRQGEQWRGWEEGPYGGGPMNMNWRPDGPPGLHGDNFRRGPPGGHGGGRIGPENWSSDGGPPPGRGVQASSWRRGEGGGDVRRQESGPAADSWRRMDGPDGGQDSWRMRGGPGSHGGGYPGGPPASYMMGFRDPAGGAGIYPRPDMYPVHQFGGYFRQPGMMDDRGMGMGPRPMMDGYGPPGAPGMDRFGRYGHGQRGSGGPSRNGERRESERAKAGGEEQHMRDEERERSDGDMSEEERVAKRRQLLQTSGHIDWALDSEEGNGMDFGVPPYVKPAAAEKVGEHQNAEVGGGEIGGRKDGEADSRGPLEMRTGVEGGPGFSTPRESPKESVRILKRPGENPFKAPTVPAKNSNGHSVAPPVSEHVTSSSDSGKQVPERLSPDTKVDASVPSAHTPSQPPPPTVPPQPPTPERVEQSQSVAAGEVPVGVSAASQQSAPQDYGAAETVEKTVTRDKGLPDGSGGKAHGFTSLPPTSAEKASPVGSVPPWDLILAAPLTAAIGLPLPHAASPHVTPSGEKVQAAAPQGEKQEEVGEKTGGSAMYDRQREQLKEQAQRAQQRRLDTESSQNQRRGGEKGSRGRGDGRRGPSKVPSQNIEGAMGGRPGRKVDQAPSLISEGQTPVNDEQARNAAEGGKEGGGRGGQGRAGHPDSGAEPHVREAAVESGPVDRMSGAVLDTPILRPPQSRSHMGSGPGGRPGVGMGMGSNVRSLPGHGVAEALPQAPGQHLLPTPPMAAQMQNVYSNRHMQYQMHAPPQGHMQQQHFMPHPSHMVNPTPQVLQQQAAELLARRTQGTSPQLHPGMQPVGLPPPPPLATAPLHTQSNPVKQMPPPPAQVPPLTLGEAIGVHPRVETAAAEGGQAKAEGVGRHGGAGEGEGPSHKGKRKVGGGGRGGGKHRGNNGGEGHVGNQQMAGGTGRSSDMGGGVSVNDPAPHNALLLPPSEEATVGPMGKGGIVESVVPAHSNTTGNVEGRKGQKDNRDVRAGERRLPQQQKPAVNSTEQPSVPVTGVTPSGAVPQGAKKPVPQRVPKLGREGMVQDVRLSDKPQEGREGGGRGGRGSHAPPKVKEWVVMEGASSHAQPPKNRPSDVNLEAPKTPPPQKVRRAEMEHYSPKPAVPAKGRAHPPSAPGPGLQQQAKGQQQVFRQPLPPPPPQLPRQAAPQQLPPQPGAPQATPVQQAGTVQGAHHQQKAAGVEGADAVAAKDREQAETEGPAKGGGRGRNQQRRAGSQRGGGGKEDVVGVEEKASAPSMPETRVAPGGRVEHGGGAANRPMVVQRGFVAQPQPQSDAQSQPQPQQPPVLGSQASFLQPRTGPAHLPFSGQLAGRALNGAVGGRGSSRGRGSAPSRGGLTACGEGDREGGEAGRNQGLPRGGARGGHGRRGPHPNSGAHPVANAKGPAAGAVQS